MICEASHNLTVFICLSHKSHTIKTRFIVLSANSISFYSFSRPRLEREKKAPCLPICNCPQNSDIKCLTLTK